MDNGEYMVIYGGEDKAGLGGLDVKGVKVYVYV